VAAIAARHQARVVRSEISGGPAQARNRALALARGELIAVLDSDCVPSAGWLEALAGHFADPLVGAVAPRVRPAGAAADGRPLVARYLAARSPLDMGGREAGVTPGGRVSYVPTAALLVRRTALAGGFDPGLRYGEDVDLVWRLGDGGWRVRYDPRVTVEHHEPVTLAAALRRRFRYGTSAGPLARRHPGRMAPAALTPWPAAAAVALTTGHRRLAAAIAGGQGAALARRLAPLRVPPGWIARWIAEAAYGAALSLSRYASMFAAAPVAAWAWRARRPGLAAALLLPGLDAWWRRRPAVDPVRFAALALADDAAYGVGVVWGAMRAGTVAPLLPRMRSVSGG
jgi:mycofactocin system glycosyltransferase